MKSKSYTIYDVRSGKIESITYNKKSAEVVNLAGKTRKTLNLSWTDPLTGRESELCIDSGSGERLKLNHSGLFQFELADVSVVKEFGQFDWDDVLFVKTNKSIENIHGIDQMKTRAELHTEPAVKFSDLNFGGQTFKGRISDGHIEGEFEVTCQKYRGQNAPAFPAKLISGIEHKQYLAPGRMIESDDAILISHAKEITAGSADVWEAINRIASWVGENISGLASGSARDTFDSRKGLCGEKSRLVAAFCRAMGIPARVVWGALYTREYGGSFGNHAWNEVYIHGQGWVAIDATIGEYDYLNSGHIRLGVMETPMVVINFEKIDILSYRMQNQEQTVVSGTQSASKEEF